MAGSARWSGLPLLMAVVGGALVVGLLSAPPAAGVGVSSPAAAEDGQPDLDGPDSAGGGSLSEAV
ncbi:MAG: hypothetical protein U0990_03135, partial [Candidatus Nanopelagicales bacterium]|nr:hypothetical protein [Candidatus Nanopelagicales bacterium]MDZ4249066.1 hypothetical protein [Candidatus Nanopelagicales bacterium]